MKNISRVASAFSLIAALLASQSLIPARADGDRDRPIRLYANAGGGPVGSIDAWSRVAIDGRDTMGERLIWGGELIQARSGSVHVLIEGTARVSLARGAIVRLARTRNDFDEGEGNVLVATIIAGSASIRLDERACAYVEAFGSAFVASRAARFRVDLQGEKVSLAVTSGTVDQAQTTPQRNYRIRPVGLGAALSVRARATRQIQVQVVDENDRPVRDVPVLFALGSGGGGSFGGAAAATSITVTTNAQGIATTTFTAGATPSSTSITATVPGTNASFTTSVTISAAPVLSATTLTVLAAAGGAAAAGIAVGVTRNNKQQDITPLPPDVRPR